MHKILRSVLCLCVLGGSASCVSLPYQRLDQATLSRTIPITPPGEPQFEHGHTNVVIDSIGWAFGIPSKLILLDRRVDNHHVGLKPEEALREYLAYNGLADVKIRINQYAPQREFRRLVRNKNVAWGWRYSLGILSCLYGTILPGRLFGGDNYNPYTDTISLYSDIPAIGLHEGGHAKDFSGRTLKGTYAFAYMLPVFSLYVESRASSDAISYLYTQSSADAEKEAYRILYPAMGTYVGGMFSAGLGPFSPWYYAGVIPGHILGRSKAAKVDDVRERRFPVPVIPEKKETPPIGEAFLTFSTNNTNRVNNN